MPLVITAALWLLISFVAIVVTIRDKRAAKVGRRRTPEATLLWIGFFGGAVAMLATMKLIRHKTRKAKFMVGLPLIIVLHLLMIGVLLVWYSVRLFA